MARSRPFAFLSIGVVLPVLPRYTEGPFGERNWYLPRWLRRMPKLGRRPVEPPGHSSADSSRVFLA